MILSAALGVAGAMLSAATAAAQNGGPVPGTPPAQATRPTVAVFNMAKVMRDFGQAKYQIFTLNNRKTELSKNLVAWRAEFLKIQNDLRQNPTTPKKEEWTQRMVDLARMVEDEDRRINKQLNDEASSIICALYDKMKAVVDKTAELNGYHIVFAYPDGTTPEDLKSPYIKELKLKPPAAQPFYVAPHADITEVVSKTLNVWYPPVDPVTNQPIDLAKLDELMRLQTHPAGPAGSQLPSTNNAPPGGAPINPNGPRP
jgi:Skp family chaperone for outer membrane proteins